MKKVICAVLSVVLALSSFVSAVPVQAADTSNQRAAQTEILHELYEAEDARISSASVATSLDDYHGTGYVTNLANGSEVTFEVNVPTTAKYGAKLRYSNGTGSNRTVSLYVNGSFARTVTLAPGINADTWAYQTEAVDLRAGTNTISYRAADSGGVSLDRIAMSWLYEAEEAVKLGTANDNADSHPGYSGSGFASGYSNTGYGRQFTVNVPAAGQYSLVMRYAAGQTDSGGRTISLVVNGKRIQCRVNTLRSWDIWWDHQKTIDLNAGQNTIVIEKQNGDDGSINIDYITVKPVQWTYAGEIQRIDGNNTKQLTLTLDNCKVQLTSVGTNAVKVWLEPEGRFNRMYESFAVVDEDINPQKLNAVDKGSYYEVDAGDMVMRLQKNPFKITYLDKNGNVVMENENQSMGWTTDGELMVNNVLPEDEAFWGLGEKLVDFNRRGEKVYMWAVDTWGAVIDDSMPSDFEDGRYSMATPYFVSSRGYSIYFDNSSRTVFDMGKTDPNKVSFGTENPNPGGELLYYFIYGGSDDNSVKQATKTYSDLVGKSVFMPQWSLGNIQCHYGYTQSDVERVAQAYRDNKIPLDAMMVDIEWYNYLCTPTSWNSKNFPDPDGMISKLRSLNLRLGVIDDPNVTNRDNNADFVAGDTNGYFVKDQTGKTKLINWPWGGASGLTDFFNPKAREWWGDLHDKILDQGVECFWLDMCEPSKYNADWLFYNEDGKSYGSMSEVKNALGLMHQKAMYDKNTEDGDRVFMTSRTGFSGTHRYSSIWTGDIEVAWDSQHQQINNGMSLSMSGYNYWGFDIGGFFGDATDEMFQRMIELATFTPIHRFHYMTGGSKEAYTHNATAVSQKYIGLRYRLMPYTYSITADNIVGIGIEAGLGEGGTGVPISRPLAMNYPNDPKTYDLDTEYMSGNSFLVAPMVESGTTKQVYFPEGEWYDYENGKTVYAGNQTIQYYAPQDVLPLFVKAGSIIPMMPLMQYIGEKPVDEITLDVYPTLRDGSFNFVMYEDDGETLNYQKGIYTTTAYDCTVDIGSLRDTITMNIGKRTGTYTNIDDRDYMMQFHCSDYANLSVTLDGRTLSKKTSLSALNSASEGYYVDNSTGICYVKVHDTAEAMEIVLVGDSGTNTNSIRLDAERGTLSGCTAKNETVSAMNVGYVDGFNANSKVTFQSFNMSKAGYYPVYVTYKSVDSDATITMTCGDETVSLTPNASNDWAQAVVLLPLKAGTNTITLQSNKNIKIDRIQIAPSEVDYKPTNVIVTEAENGTMLGGAAFSTSIADHSHFGYVPLASNGNGVQFNNVRVLTDGTYAVTIRYAEGGGVVTVQTGNTTQTVTLPAVKTGLWSEEIVNLPLKAGSDNSITVTKTSGSQISLDCLQLDVKPYALTLSKTPQNNGFEAGSLSGWTLNNTTGGYGIDQYDSFAGNYKLYFYDGNNGVEKRLTQTVTGLANGSYVVRARVKVYNNTPEICRFELSNYGGSGTTYTEIPYAGIWDTVQSDIVEVKNGQLTIGIYYKAGANASLQLDDVTVWKVSELGTVSRDELANAVARAEKRHAAAFSADTWNDYALAAALGSSVLNNANATGEEIYSALVYLEAKEAALIRVTVAGDVNEDGVVDASDLMKLKELILNKSWTDSELTMGDLNKNNTLDVSDIMMVKNIILGK